MSTASGALIGCSTVTTTDLLGKLWRRPGVPRLTEVNQNRVTTLVLGILAIGIAMVVNDVVGALTVAYNLLVGGLLVAIVGALFWRRGTTAGAVASIAAGSLVAVVSMILAGLEANEPIFYGLGASLVVYVVVSLLTPPTADEVLRVWSQRLAGSADLAESSPATAATSH